MLVLLGAVLCTATVFVYATPQHPYRSPDAVRSAFAAHGVHLRDATSPDGVHILSLCPCRSRPPRFRSQSRRAPRRSIGGPKLQPYDERFANVDVTYGGRDEQLLERVRAAVADLR